MLSRSLPPLALDTYILSVSLLFVEHVMFFL